MLESDPPRRYLANSGFMVQMGIIGAWSESPAGSSIPKSKEDSTNLMFLPDAARSIAAQLLLGLSYLQANGICHGDEDN